MELKKQIEQEIDSLNKKRVNSNDFGTKMSLIRKIDDLEFLLGLAEKGPHHQEKIEEAFVSVKNRPLFS